MDNVDLIKRNIEMVVGQNQKNDNGEKEKFNFSESYLETKTSKFVRLLAQKNTFQDDEEHDYNVYNSNLIIDKSIIHILQNEMMSIFTLIVGIVEGVMLLSLFVVINNSNTQFLQKFASISYI